MKTKIQLKQTITLRYPANRMNIAQITNMQARLYPLITQSGKEIIRGCRSHAATKIAQTASKNPQKFFTRKLYHKKGGKQNPISRVA